MCAYLCVLSKATFLMKLTQNSTVDKTLNKIIIVCVVWDKYYERNSNCYCLCTHDTLAGWNSRLNGANFYKSHTIRFSPLHGVDFYIFNGIYLFIYFKMTLKFNWIISDMQMILIFWLQFWTVCSTARTPCRLNFVCCLWSGYPVLEYSTSTQCLTQCNQNSSNL